MLGSDHANLPPTRATTPTIAASFYHHYRGRFGITSAFSHHQLIIAQHSTARSTLASAIAYPYTQNGYISLNCLLETASVRDLAHTPCICLSPACVCVYSLLQRHQISLDIRSD